MRTLILYAAFLSAVAGLRGKNLTLSNEVQTLTSVAAPIVTMTFTPEVTFASTPQSIAEKLENASTFTKTVLSEVISTASSSNSDTSAGASSANVMLNADQSTSDSVQASVPLTSTETVLASTSGPSGSNEQVPLAGSGGVGLWPTDEVVDEKPSRRVITYDQRQEGQYNIRADLENFMIVLIPPNANDGLNLLDLLTKASFKHDPNNLKSLKKKYGIMQLSSNQQNRHYSKSEHGKLRHSNFLSKEGIHHISHHQVPQYGDSVNVDSDAPNDNEHSIEYIEGRTPYHVDITSNNEGGPQARMQSERHVVDVLPPPYPLAYQQLIKPYHLEAQSTVIQTLPPQELDVKRASGNYLEAYEQQVLPKPVENSSVSGQTNFLIPPASVLNENNSSDLINSGASSYSDGISEDSGATLSATNLVVDKIGYNRYPRAIRGHNFLDGNRVTNSIGNVNDNIAARRVSTALLPLYRSDMSMGAAQLYPPIDVPQPTGSEVYWTMKVNPSHNAIQHSFEDVLEAGSPQSLDARFSGMASEIIVPPVQLGDEFAFDLHGNDFNDPDTKALLSNGIERCAPGKRRDSYGVCREIEGY